MSDLKYQSITQLEASKRECQNYIKVIKSNLAGQETRLKWIDKYLYEKTPIEMTIAQIEAAIGHKVIIGGQHNA